MFFLEPRLLLISTAVNDHQWL